MILLGYYNLYLALIQLVYGCLIGCWSFIKVVEIWKIVTSLDAEKQEAK